MEFKELGICPEILKALENQGYKAPSPIQEKAIPEVLAGRDLLGCAQTGSGKTAAFAVPILQLLSKEKTENRVIRALILTPTRELAVQNLECLEAYGENLPLRSGCILGGVNQRPQERMLAEGIDILVATPGRLNDLVNQGIADISHVEIFVLDEADRMLDMGFLNDVRKIGAHMPSKRQTLLFSATMPKEIVDLIDTMLHDYARVTVNPVSSTVPTIDQRIYFVDRKNKTALLIKLLNDENVFSALVFTRTKSGADKLVRELTKAKILSAAIHGNKSQNSRQHALNSFKDGTLRLLVATDIAARGIDIEGLSYVFNYNLPEEAEMYVHRIGRTGRAGMDGNAVSFCSFEEKPLLKDIEKVIKQSVPVVTEHPFPMEDFTVRVKEQGGRRTQQSGAKSQNARDAHSQERRAEKPQRNHSAAAQDKPSAKPQTAQNKRFDKPWKKKTASPYHNAAKKTHGASGSSFGDFSEHGEKRAKPIKKYRSI